MKFLIAFVVVLLNIINVPLNILYLRVQKWYLPMWHKDKVIFFAFAPFYWILVLLTFIIGYPTELLARMIEH